MTISRLKKSTFGQFFYLVNQIEMTTMNRESSCFRVLNPNVGVMMSLDLKKLIEVYAINIFIPQDFQCQGNGIGPRCPCIHFSWDMGYE